MWMPTALIIGVSGQDGSYLAKKLVDRGYSVVGTSRDHVLTNFRGLDVLGVRTNVTLETLAPSDFRSLYRILRNYEPDEIYNLAGQSSVGRSFEQPFETYESIAIATINILECLRVMDRVVSFYNAASCESFGNIEGAATEATPFHPRSPYATAKAAAFWQVANYREAYGMRACSGILFNHESPLRSERFVTRKIIDAAIRIAAGSDERLTLGNLHIERDWGWAPDYVDAMWRMLQQDKLDDYIICTGRSSTLCDFLTLAFDRFGLDWRRHVTIDENLYRPTDVARSVGDPTKAARDIGWSSDVALAQIVDRMIAGSPSSDGTPKS